MKIADIRQFPRRLERSVVEVDLRESNIGGWHESLLRSFQVLQKVKHLLSINTPAEVILEIIEEAGE